MPSFPQRSKFWDLIYSAKNPPANKSPAPVVSTNLSIFSAFILTISSLWIILTPLSPSVIANILSVPWHFLIAISNSFVSYRLFISDSFAKIKSAELLIKSINSSLKRSTQNAS